MSSDPHAALPVRVTPLIESRFGLDGGAMFGIVPRPLWSRTNPPDDHNRIAMASRCLLIEYEGGLNVLVDVGMGQRFSPKERDIYALSGQDARLTQGLEQRALRPEEIDHVILTHLHFDHAGGLKAENPSGRSSAAFPRATHWVQRRNWSWAHSPSARDAGSYRQQDFAWLGVDADAPPLELVDGISEILPGVELLPCHGHTFGMQLVKITTASGATIVFLADLMPTSSHLRDAYVMGYDLQPLVTLEEKRALLYEIERHDWIVCFEHDPKIDFARIERDARGEPRAVALSSLP